MYSKFVAKAKEFVSLAKLSIKAGNWHRNSNSRTTLHLKGQYVRILVTNIQRLLKIINSM